MCSKSYGLMKELAIQCSQNSRAFLGTTKMGAAVLTSDDRIYPGCYLPGSTGYTTVHAEHAAIINAYSNGAKQIMAVAIYADSDDLESEIVPCGSCLQALFDSSNNQNIKIYTSDRTTYPNWSEFYLRDLLPRPWKN